MKVNVKKLLLEPLMDYQIFHEKIKLKKNIKIKEPRKWPKRWIQVFFKGYPRFEEILLPHPKLPNLSIKKTLLNRKSNRIFTDEVVEIEKISSLLHFSAGLKRKNVDQRGNRFYPSGGARYPLEVYFLSLNTELPKGLYHYYLKSDSLEKLLDIDDFNFKDFFIHEEIVKPAFLIIITAVFSRSVIKYKDRGYLHSLIEAGALSQNFYLNATANNLGVCALGGYFDEKFNNLLDIDGQLETTIMTIVGGKIPAA